MAGVEAWPPCNVTKSALDARVKAGILRPLQDVELPEWIVPSTNDREPNPPLGYVVCFLSFLDWGFGTPAGRLIRAILHYYEVELHNLNPNSVMQAAVFATVCEGFLGVPPHWNLWLHLFKAEMSARYVGGEKFPLRVGGCTLQLRQQRCSQYIWSAMPSSNRGWQNGWFYLRNNGGLLPAYTGKMVTESPQKWVWGAPAEEQKRLAPLLAGLEKLRDGHGGDGVPQEEFAPAGAAASIHVRDDPGRPLGRDEGVGRADIGIGHRRPGREDNAPEYEELPGGADAP